MTGVRTEGRQFGPYRLVERIALGEFAEVFTAVPVDADAGADAERGGATENAGLCALKRLTRAGLEHPEVRALFARECALAQHLRHPNVVRTLAVGVIDDVPYLAGEYIAGCDVGAFVETSDGADGGARPPAGVIARIGLEVCAALSYLQGARDAAGQALDVIHRDLAPRNIRCSTAGAVQLIDFSAAHSRLCDPDDRTVRGTYAYMSPEQVRGETLDGRSDLFGLGVVLWELCAGRRLFRRPAHYLILAAVVEQAAPALVDIDAARRLLGAHTAAVDGLLGRALAKDRDSRLADADEFRGALADIAARAGWDVGQAALAAQVRALGLA